MSEIMSHLKFIYKRQKPKYKISLLKCLRELKRSKLRTKAILFTSSILKFNLHDCDQSGHLYSVTLHFFFFFIKTSRLEPNILQGNELL